MLRWILEHYWFTLLPSQIVIDAVLAPRTLLVRPFCPHFIVIGDALALPEHHRFTLSPSFTVIVAALALDHCLFAFFAHADRDWCSVGS
jgi:hypothetical protein